MKPMGEAGISVQNSNLYIDFPNNFTRQHFFYTDRCGHYFVNKRYIISRVKLQPPFPWRFLMIYVVKGEMLLLVKDKEYFIRENEIAVFDMRHPHLYAACCDTEQMWFCFDGNCSETMIEKICAYSHVYKPMQISRTYNLLKEIIDGFQEQKPVPDEIISGYFHIVLSDLLAQQRYDSNQQPTVIEKAINYMENNYDKPINIGEIAEMLYLNASYFSQKFKMVTGISPKQYLINIRLNAAKILLQDTSWSIREISERTGFLTDNYFSWYFHKKFGLTPKDYRKEFLE